MKVRSAILLSILLLAVLTLAVSAGILIIGHKNTLRANLSVMSRSPKSFQLLSDNMRDLQEMTSNIDQYSLLQIKDALNKTSILVNQATAEFKAQQDSWNKVQGQINKDKVNFLEIRQQLEDVQKLQSGEILRLKTLLDETSRPSLLSDLTDLFVSFVFGVLASIVASHIYSWLKSRKHRGNAKAAS